MAPPQLTVQVQGQGVATADYLNGVNQTCDTPADLRVFTGITGMQVYMRGYVSPGDGGQGDFYWNSASTAADDGGVTTIAPAGSTQGRWIRLPGAASSTSYNFAVDIGGPSVIVAALATAPPAFVAGISVFIQVAANNSGATTINLNGFGATNVQYAGTNLVADQLVAGQVYLFVYDGTVWELQSILSPAALATAIEAYLSFTSNPYEVDIGATNALAVTLSPAPSSYTAGLSANIKVANTNSGATTVNFNGLGAKNILYQGAALTSGQLHVGQIYAVQYDGTQFQLLTPPYGSTSNITHGGSTSIAYPANSVGAVGSSGWRKETDGKITFWAYVQMEDYGTTAMTAVAWTYPTGGGAPTFATAPLGWSHINVAAAAGQGYGPASSVLSLYSLTGTTAASFVCHNSGGTNVLCAYYVEVWGY